MMEICNYLSECGGDAMKHPPVNLETFEFNLGRVSNLKCESAEKCGNCETCSLNSRISFVKSWFLRLGDHSQRRFMLGLLRRIHSVDLLTQLVNLLQPLMNKDYTYARTRTHPGLDTDLATLSSDHALTSTAVEYYLSSTWDWFTEANYWTKANFAMNILQLCGSHLLFILSSQAQTLLVSEERALSAKPGSFYTEAGSVHSSEYSYDTINHPELSLLTQTCPGYSQIHIDPFTGDSLELNIREDNNDEIISDSISSIDPACMIIPTGSKAYSGVARYKDFIRSLPVHLAKYILSFLDRSSLTNALCVSDNWRNLAEEVHQEHYVNQQLIEEVMLMQGAAAQCANPVFANDIDVPVPNLHPGSNSVIYTNNDTVLKTHFRNDVNFDTAYNGVSTRNVILEERNVYCGAYNVMVLKDQYFLAGVDINRVLHTDGGNLIATGSKDRKVRFLDAVSGKEKGPLITGHAGSIRCVFICEDKGFVLSGSYDTSIRLWSIETGHCLKIFRGHRDTVNAIIVLGDVMASCGKDGACKIWNVTTGKCQQTFRHRSSACSLALSKGLCITGCESGKIRVWNLETGNLVKTLIGHHGPVVDIKFDRWHIVSGSRDGYVLAWSSLGDHSRCLTALRHPKEVLCIEFMYLRVITGSADGRLRIWNLITGQCCRIMRGNSRSDPILSIITNGDRITLNTSRNLLVLNFEKVEWDYTLETDAVPPLAQYGSYSDAPIRPQSYAYVRAMRMKKAGATNSKIIDHDGKLSQNNTFTQPWLQSDYPAPQILHSAKTLSARSLESARKIQSSRSGEATFESRLWTGGTEGKKSDVGVTWHGKEVQMTSPPPSAPHSAPISPVKRTRSRSCSRPNTVKSQPSSVKIMDPPVQQPDELEIRTPIHIERRVSWAFDKPLLPSVKDISLSEMKALLRSQIRMKTENIIPPDFIYLTVNSIQRTMSHSETNTNTTTNLKEQSQPIFIKTNRPSSSPGKIDPKTKVPIEELGLEYLKAFSEDGESMSEISDLKSIRSLRTKEPSKPLPPPEKEVYSVRCVATPIKTKKSQSLHPKHIKSTLPRGRVIRPLSAAVMQKLPVSPEFVKTLSQRPITAPMRSRATSLGSIPPSIAPALPGMNSARQRKQEMKSQTSETASIVPMLMYSQDVKDKIEQLKKKRQGENCVASSSGSPAIGKVSPFNDPLRTSVKFELRTNEQEQEIVNIIKNNYKDKKASDEETQEKRKRAAWLAKARSRP
ncbi:hypothetical protein LOTGIDRAFT_154169 [Lottia gigantea]|uniref:F-box domain-containing protein n=1 Tax=Lottia gigantea TaxID=225164 RepID=V4BKI4_LOTGI|nr:hypothetical protein LOTGIDRAFT_154169 [Lottia gigantea]ESO89089.1 hypothetical protein LOTGIDRAFT_154169 [Lottia gigantea]